MDNTHIHDKYTSAGNTHIHDKYTSAGNTYIHEKYTSVGNTYIHDKYTSAGHTKSFCLEKITIKSSFLFKRFGHKAFISVLFLQASYKDAEIVLPIKGAFEMLLKLELHTHDIQCIYIYRYISSSRGEKAWYMKVQIIRYVYLT